MNVSVAAACNNTVTGGGGGVGGAGIASGGTPKKGILKYKRSNDNTLTNESDPYSR